MKNSNISFVIAGVFGILSLPVLADTKQTSNLDSIYEINRLKPYIGLNFVYNKATFHDKTGNELSSVVGESVNTSDLFNANHFGFNLDLGIKINKYFAIEGFFQHTRSGDKKTQFDDYEVSVYPYHASAIIKVYDFKMLSFGVDAIGSLPIYNSDFSLIGSLGIGYYSISIKDSAKSWLHYSNGNIYDEKPKYTEATSENNLGFRFGIGGQYNFSETWATRLMLKYVEINSDKSEDETDGLIDISLGLQYTF